MVAIVAEMFWFEFYYIILKKYCVIKCAYLLTRIIIEETVQFCEMKTLSMFAFNLYLCPNYIYYGRCLFFVIGILMPWVNA